MNNALRNSIARPSLRAAVNSQDLVIDSGAATSLRPVQPGYCLTFNGTTHRIDAAHLAGTETVVSSQGTSTPSVSVGQIDFTAGTSNNIILSDGTQYNLNESTGTVAIDSSGDGNDGTLVNGPSWTTDNSLPYSWLNQVGYTDVSGLLTPRDESDPTKDTDGNALEWSGSAFPRRPEYRGSYAGEFDGTDDTIITPLIPDNDTATFTLSAWVKPSVTGSLDGIIGAFEASSDQISLQRHSSDKYRVRYGTGAGNTLLEATTTPSTSRWDMVTTTYDGATMIIYVNGVEENSASVAAFSGGNVAYRVGGYQGSSFAWQGSLRDAVITSDVFTATEVLDMFTDGAVPVLSDGLRYPIAEGVGATAVANSHNDAETTWDFENIGTGDTIAPETSHLSNFDAVTFSDTNYSLGITSPIDSVFWRDISTVLKDRATGYGATLTGAGLVYANNYTDGERWNNLAPWDDDNIWND